MLVGTRKGLFILRHRGAWELAPPDFLGHPVTMVLATGARWYAGLEHGHYGPKLHVSTDQGETWTEIATPAFPPAPDVEGAPAVRTIWSLEEGSSEGHLWCGTIPGGLFHSTDHGASWRLVESLWNRPERARWFGGGADQPGIHSICVDCRDRRKVLIGVSCGGVWATEDDGETWELRGKGLIARFMPPDQQGDPEIQDPHLITCCAANPDVVWCQHHNGIFRSVDAARTFVELQAQPSTFGFAVAAHPREPETAWLVPAASDDLRVPVDGAMVVNRTRDGGVTWEPQRAGLPQKDAYDLVFRHALAVDAAGRRLAFGSTTGSLWTTEDGGSSWTTVSTHLPPVYVLRFARAESH